MNGERPKPDGSAASVLVAIDHAGIRVRDKARAAEFYRRLGFEVALDDEPSRCLELENEAGVRLHLIWNASHDSAPHNVLLDEPVKQAGYTHVAFTVVDLDAVLTMFARESIRATEGPKQDNRRRYVFCRDPDGNVLEFSQLRGP